jgi:hypothetical protein
MSLSLIHTRFIRYFIGIFSIPRVQERIAMSARLFAGEANRMTTGIKGEAVETKEVFQTLAKFIRKEKLSRAEKKIFKRQVISLLKGAGVMVPVMLIPLPFVSTLLLILMDHLLLSMKIKILPGSFYPENPKELLTAEGVESDFRKALLEKHN